MRKSFRKIKPIDLRGKERKKAAAATTTGTSPQKSGIEHHKKLKDQINQGTRNGTEGEMLKAIEMKFTCEFLKAEVSINGYAAIKSKVDFYSGIMDAVAIRRSPEDDLEVFVVDWKTTSKTDLANLNKWWEEAETFKKPLYQCLLYRELLQMHLKLNEINARVGIMLVPFHQSEPELLMPGLCMDVQEMEKKGLLDGLKKYEFSVSRCAFHAIKPTCKVFNLEGSDSVDESTNLLKEDTLLKDIIRDDATVADLRQEFGLLKLKVTGNDEKFETEGRAEKGKQTRTRKNLQPCFRRKR